LRKIYSDLLLYSLKLLIFAKSLRVMEELLKDLREVCEKHGLTLEKDSESLYVDRPIVDMVNRVTKREVVFRCFKLTPSTEDEIKCMKEMWYPIYGE